VEVDRTLSHLNLRTWIAEHGYPAVLDGAMGTLLQERGWNPPALPEEVNLTSPEIVRDIHASYVVAGANIVETNSFGANPIKLASRNLDGRTREINAIAASLAKETVGDRLLVAGSIGPLGLLIEPLGELPFEDAVSAFKEQVAGLAEGGVDFILIETMIDLREAKAAVLAVKEVAPHLPFVVSFTFENNGRTLTGTPPEVAAHWTRTVGASAVGINCGSGPEEYIAIVDCLAHHTGIPIFAYPNAGLPGSQEYWDPERFSRAGRHLVEAGASVVGGCCGTTPQHIESLVRAVRTLSLPHIKEIHGSPLCSISRLSLAGAEYPLLVVGERINVSRPSALREEVSRYEWNVLKKEAREQEEAGAHAIDINVSLPQIDGSRAMREAVLAAESATMLPLSLDSDNMDAIEAGLRIASGIPLINSVTAKGESLERGIALAAKYGACLVVLLLDERGILEDADKRISVAKRVCECADALGFPRKRLFFDALTLSVGSDDNAARVTLETVRRIRSLGACSILGISNVSYGLPQRPLINRTFLAMAMAAGLDAVIADPLDSSLMETIAAGNLLVKRDRSATAFITFFSHRERKKEEKATEKEAIPQDQVLRAAIIRGEENTASSLASALIESGMPSMKLINDVLVPALNVVGELYECGDYFLPQLMNSAKAAQAAFAALEKGFSAGEKSLQKGTIVMATVEGDLHDIGKNLVVLVLRSHGYNVIDLGKDVPLDAILKRATDERADMVGLSSLMTTTTKEMARAVSAVREKKLPFRVIVGGAAVTEEFARHIGADGYAPDAVGAVKLVETLLGDVGRREGK